MTAKSLSLAALLLAATTSAAIAQEETPTPPVEDFEIYEFEFNIIDDILNQPVYAPFRQEGTVKESSRPAYVINREQIEAQGYRTVNEALKYFPGVFIDSTAGVQLGAQSSQIIRGSNSSTQTLILLDGRPINTFNQGAFDLSTLTTNNVERIELIPGGGSTLFGSGAIGGVVNIVTRQPELNDGWTTNVGAEIGTLGYNSQEVAVNYGGEKSTVRFGYNRTAAANDFNFNLEELNLSGTRENAQADIQNFNFQATSLLGDRHKLRFDGIYAEKDIGVPGGFPSPDLDQFAEAENLLLSLELESRLGNSDDSALVTRIFADFTDTLDNNPEGLFPFIFTTEGQSLGAQIQHNWQFSERQNISYGFDYRSIDIAARSASNFGTDSYAENLSQGALFANYAFNITPELTTSLGLRQDFNSLADGSFTSPSAGILWKAGENTSLRANYARNFRTPTSTELFFPNFGNPDLRPEFSNSFDLGIDQRLGRDALLRLTYFNNVIDDAIPVNQAININKIRNQGVEAELTVQLSSSIYAFANYTYNDSEILENVDATVIGNEFAFSGTDSFNLGLAYENPQGIYAGIFLRRIGDRITNNANTASLESYTNVDLRARYPIAKNVNLTASWENIFGEDYITFSGFSGNFPGVGSRFQIGVNAKFR